MSGTYPAGVTNAAELRAHYAAVHRRLMGVRPMRQGAIPIVVHAQAQPVAVTIIPPAVLVAETPPIEATPIEPPRLPGIEPPAARCPSIMSIVKAVAAYYKTTPQEITSARRQRVIVKPRHVAFYLAKVLTPRSLPEIGRRFGNRDHTTILNGVRNVTRRVDADATLRADVDALTATIMAAT